MNYYTADLHFGHKNVILFDKRPFTCVEEMDHCLIENWNTVVKDRDHIYILGDFCYCSSKTPEWYLKQLKGKKHLIQGNHDGVTIHSPQAVGLLESVDKMLFVQDGSKRLVLCHFPIAEWNGFYRGAYHLYGHIHNRDCPAKVYMDSLPRALPVGCMLHEYKPMTLCELIRAREERCP